MVANQHRKQYTREFRDEAVRMVLESSRPIAHVARELGLNEGTLGNWVNRYRKEHGPEEEPELNISERARLCELEDEVRELRMKNEFLGKAAAFFAQEYR
jgi:transposase